MSSDLLQDEKKADLPQDFSILTKNEQATIDEFLKFLNASPTPFHAVAWLSNVLAENGFKLLDEKDDWTILKPGKYYYTRNQSTLMSFIVPEKWKQGNGFTIMAGHTDSPNFRIKPCSKKTSQGYLQIGVEEYGGGLWHTWFDRDLSIAGRVIVANKDSKNKITHESRLVRIPRPLLRISTLAVHLNRGVNEKGFEFNHETETVPIFATEAATQLNAKVNQQNQSPIAKDHHPLLFNIIANQLNISPDQIIDFDLHLYDTNPSCQGGALNEFVYSGRLDNLCSCYVLLKSILNAKVNPDNSNNIRIFACFDNEEVGSVSNRGAASNMMISTMKRLNGDKNFEASIQRSILVSCDMAHGVHPNFSSKHEANHTPHVHKGLVIKYNSNQKYATTIISTYHLSAISQKLNIPLQKFMVRNDSPCGSTIGPILSAKCGIRTIDVGLAQLSMHSIREVCGVKDVCDSIRLFSSYYENFETLDEGLKVD